MLRRRLHLPLTLSAVAAIATQLAVPAIAAAATGGGDFPALRLLLAVR
jgi:hypothetical protein